MPGPSDAPALPAFAGTEEGRVVAGETLSGLPNLPFGHPDTYEYHYRDHLGNLRLAYRPRTPQGQDLRLTNEPESASDEADGQGFSNFVPWRSAAHAHAGLHGLRATVASGRTGRTAQRVRLLAGQALAASAMALYEGTGGGSAQQRAAVAGRAADGGTAPPPSEVVGSGKTAAPALEMQKNGLTLASRIPDPSVPRARLVLRLFAEASGGTVLHEQEAYLDNTASWSWQQLSLGKLATVDCWAEVYVENLSSQAVWFDDLEIATGALPVAIVVQETHYDPWGLELAGIGYLADPTLEDKFTYNGKEKVDDMALNWLDYGARNYDARLGRWWSVDPHAHNYDPVSPYAYVGNNPVRLIDPDGRDWGITISGNTITITFTGKVVDETGKTREKGELEGYAKRMSAYLTSKFQGKTEKGFDVVVNADITVAENGDKDLSATDHAIRIVNDGEVPETKNGKGYGFAKLGGKFIYLNDKILSSSPATEGDYAGTGLDKYGNATLERTFGHEAGHTAGLFHPGNGEDEQGNARLLQGSAYYMPMTDFGNNRNLMYQSGQPMAGETLINKQRSAVVKRISDTQNGLTSPNIYANTPVNSGPQKYQRKP